MAEKCEFKNKRKSHKLLKREKLHMWKLPLLQFMMNTIATSYHDSPSHPCLAGADPGNFNGGRGLNTFQEESGATWAPTQI